MFEYIFNTKITKNILSAKTSYFWVKQYIIVTRTFNLNKLYNRLILYYCTHIITDIMNTIISTSMMVPGARYILMTNMMGIQITEQMTMSQPSTMDQVG